MNFPSIDIQGSILSTDLLAKIRSEQATFQQGKDFHPDLSNAKLKDEISLAWQEAKGQWTIYKSKLSRLKEGETGTTETRNFWISPLLTNLGYNLTFNRQSEELNGKSFSIGYRDSNLDGFPVYVGGYHESLDKRPENKQLRVSPHAMVQEYLNYSEHLYGMVTNGRQLRLLRDASRITRLSYVEFNVEKMMEEDLYSDFVILYRVLHASRMPKKIDGGAESIIEKYHQEGLEAGSTIRSKLGDAVKEAIKSLANGFINHPNNTVLREAVASGNFSADEYYRHQLRIIYRLLFLFVIEERNLVYADNKSPEAKRFNQIYFNYYSLLRLRKLAKKLLPPEASRHYDLWQGLISTFSLFEKKEIGEKLGIMALQGDLFGYHAISGNGYDLHQCYLSNAVLLNIIKSLSYFENENGVLIAVNYGGLDVEEFGSVYEGLLELKLEVKKIEGSDQYSCSFDTSNERGKSGSHYTPEELVQPLIKHSLEYLIEDRVDSGQWLVVSNEKNYLKIAPYESFKKLSGINSLAEINGLGKNDLLFYKVLSERRDIWIDFANKKSSSEYSGQHSGGTSKEHNGGISSISRNNQRLFSGVRDFNDTLKELGLSDDRAIRNAVAELRRNNQAFERINQCIKEITTHYPLSTTHLKLSKQPIIDQLLSLKIADVACGSGHILLSAARRLSLEIARVQTEEEQPNPVAIRKAMKDVVRNCIYGVDKNPLAVELCKIALWLEAYNPGEPLNFLDHHIKCGDAIVGLAHRSELENGIADEAFKTLPGDDKDIAKTWRDKNVKERKERAAKALQLKAEFEKSTENSVQEAMTEYKSFSQLPETTPEEIERKAKAYKKFIDGKGFTFLKAMADTQCAQFFIPKTEANKDYLMTDADYRLILSGYKGWQDRKVAKATAVAHEQRFFHWFIEFPEVFSEGGFDCVLGNPPYLGAKKIRGLYGDSFLNYLHSNYNTKAQTDLIANFVLRNFSLIRYSGFVSLITTNTINDGDTRENGIEALLNAGGLLNFAQKSILWPGVANLYVSLFAISRNRFDVPKFIGVKKVDFINSFFENEELKSAQSALLSNKGLLFKGDDFSCDGFIINENQAIELIDGNKENRQVILPLINGQDLNEIPDEKYYRCIICFHDWSEEKSRQYNLPFKIVEDLVKPERSKLQPINSWNISAKNNWWLFGAYRKTMHERLSENDFCFASSVVSKYLSFKKYPSNYIFSNAVYVFIPKNKFSFACLHSTIHYEWARKYSSKLKTDLRYTATDVFETFPFPQNLNPHQEQDLETIGEAYHEHRRQLMLGMQFGLTKTYNLFHSNAITAQAVNEKDKQVAALQKHLGKTPNTISFNEAIQGILKLRELHVQMDEVVLDAYGWNDIALRHDFYEVDYLPENDRIRFTIHPDARKEVLKRLLELNHKIHEEEVRAGLWEKKGGKKKGYKTDEEEVSRVDEPDSSLGGLFNQK
jgi:hypothetical protein